MPPTPLDGKPLPADSPPTAGAYFADWLTAAGQPVLREGARQPRLAELHGPRAGRGRGRPARDQPADATANCSTPWPRTSSTNKYDVKHLIRTIMNSAAYQRSSKPLPANAADDRFYSRYLVRRLPAEVILDAYSQVTGVPTPFTQVEVGGRRRGRRRPRLTRRHAGAAAARLAGRVAVPRRVRPARARRRPVRASAPPDASVGQALHLNNGQTLNDKLRDKNSVVAKWLGGEG